MLTAHRNLLLLVLLFTFLAVLVYIPASPSRHPVQDRDAGVFLYVAQQMQYGSVPYRDIWDHKPLGTYLLQFLGFIITGGSLWGPWALAVIFLAVSACLAFSVLHTQIDARLALGIVCTWLLGMSLFVRRDPFLTETTALPFQIGAFALALWLVEHPIWTRARWGWLFLGAMIAFSALLKPFLAGLPCLAALIILLYTPHSERRKAILWIVYGLIGPLAGALYYLVANHAIVQFYDQVILYNAAYGNVAWQDRLTSIRAALRDNIAISVTAFVAWISIGVFLWRNRPPVRERFFLLLLLIGWPFDLVVSSLSGRIYSHYYIGNFWLAFMMIGWLLLRLQDYIARAQIVFLFRWLFLGLMFVSSLEVWSQILEIVTLGEKEQQAAIAYLNENVPADQPVLIWGAETSLYLTTHRVAPTRIVYQYPLYAIGYHTAEMWQELLNSIQSQKPYIIIDTSPTNPVIPPLDPAGLIKWQSPADGYAMSPGGDIISSYDAQNYEQTDLIGGVWPVYQLKK